MDPFKSNTVAHEAFIRATMESETKYPHGTGSERDGGLVDLHTWCPKTTPLGRLDGEHASLSMHLHGHGDGHRQRKKTIVLLI